MSFFSVVFSLLMDGESRVGDLRLDPLSPYIGYIGYIGGIGVLKIALSDTSGADFENRFATDVYRISNRCVPVQQQMCTENGLGFVSRRGRKSRRMCTEPESELLHCNIVITDRFSETRKTQSSRIQGIESLCNNVIM